MWSTVLFDLDGTLTDPKVGITTCVAYALKHFGIIEDSLDNLACFIGPPLKEQFMLVYGFNDAQGDICIKKYRERFNDIGIFENELYNGIKDLLANLKAEGEILAVASSKPTVYVDRILKHFELYNYFDVILGSELDGRRTDKAMVIAEVLTMLGVKDKSEVIMIGDRSHDIIGANKNGIKSIGVKYGYGVGNELEVAGATYIANTVADIKNILDNGNKTVD